MERHVPWWRRAAIIEALERFAPDVVMPARRGLAGDLAAAYAQLPSRSIDYAVMEPAAAAGRVVMAAMDVGWTDVGTWPALLEAGAAGIDGGVLRRERRRPRQRTWSSSASTDAQWCRGRGRILAGGDPGRAAAIRRGCPRRRRGPSGAVCRRRGRGLGITPATHVSACRAPARAAFGHGPHGAFRWSARPTRSGPIPGGVASARDA
ncbi:MAG: hypothetical protein U0838_10410 [Chloroflexota bacterium]